MQSRFLRGVALVAAFGLLASCGGGGGSNNPGTPPPGSGGSAPVSVLLRDTPPAGITVLTFEVTVTGAVLQPGNVSLVSNPIEIEVKQLEIESALLSTINVPAGTYSSITLTLANPEITIKNDTGAAFSTPFGNCAAGAVCKFEANASASVSYSGAPFPLTVMANTPIGLLVDLNLDSIIQSNLAVNFASAGGVTVVQLPLPGQPTGQLEDFEVVGRVTAKDSANNQFTLQTQGNTSLTVRVDANTEFEDFDDIGCTANNFTCVAVNQILEVELRLMAGGNLIAEEVELEDDVNQEEFEGILVGIQSPTQFQMVLLKELPDVAAVEIGDPVNVTIQAGATFGVDEGGLNIPAGLAFASASDLLPGQNVQVRRRTAPTGTPPSIETDRIRLRGSRFTARVRTPGASTVVVDNLPTLFTSAGITEIEVRTSSETDFDNVPGSNAAGLAVGDTVSLRGLLFKRVGSTPVLVAKKVRRR